MTRFWFVRHGPTGAKGLIGSTDLPADLSDRPALDRLGSALPDAPVISSTLERARMTAAALGRERLTDDPALCEMHYGDWEGKDFAAIAAGWPDLSRAFWEDPGTHAAPGGESWNAMSARVADWIDGFDGNEVIVVTHMGPIMAAIAHALGLMPKQATAFVIAPLSITRLDRLPGGLWRIGSINHVA
ncbi:MAG: histidine phosphatase family protein [Rubricella sp.]